MCGIAGVLLSPSAQLPDVTLAIAAMTATLSHRGPDGNGIWIDREAGIALGHRRLSIVDLSEAGHQPMLAHGGDLITTYNGEIYNSGTIGTQLKALGHRFRGHSDTEVMLAAFESFGLEAALKRFSGMFALGVWSRRDRVLHLARDGLGKKPLYIALVRGALVFASELRAIRAYPGFRAAIAPEAVEHLLRHGWIPDDLCIYEGVFKLPPGRLLSLRPEDIDGAGAERLRAMARPWWSLSEIASAGQRNALRSEAEVEAELDGLLRLAVRERMTADVPLGAFLSGGIDSSLVAALMQAQSSRPVRTFTIGFDDTRFDEASAAAGIARHLGTEHTEFHLTGADALATVPELPRVWDEPFADESQIPTLLVSRLARQHVTVALSGDGGDECFGGYTRHVLSSRIAPLLAVPTRPRAAAAAALRFLGTGARWRERDLRALGASGGVMTTIDGNRFDKLVRVLGATSEDNLYDQLTALGGGMAVPPAAPAAQGPLPPVDGIAARFMYRDMARYLPGDILVKLDRATMAVGLEARCPLLDRRVVEFAWRVPARLKIHGGKGKWPLRRLLSRYVPEQLFNRPKHGFDVPIGSWLRGPLQSWAGDLLAESRLRREGLLDPARVQICWREHRNGRHDHAYGLWAVLMLEAWLDGHHHDDPITQLGTGGGTGASYWQGGSMIPAKPGQR